MHIKLQLVRCKWLCTNSRSGRGGDGPVPYSRKPSTTVPAAGSAVVAEEVSVRHASDRRESSDMGELYGSRRDWTP